jgi:hypothetical protein
MRWDDHKWEEAGIWKKTTVRILRNSIYIRRNMLRDTTTNLDWKGRWNSRDSNRVPSEYKSRMFSLDERSGSIHLFRPCLLRSTNVSSSLRQYLQASFEILWCYFLQTLCLGSIILSSKYINQNTTIIIRKDRVNKNTPIEINKGVRQKCPLSPVLFNIYSDDHQIVRRSWGQRWSLKRR